MYCFAPIALDSGHATTRFQPRVSGWFTAGAASGLQHMKSSKNGRGGKEKPAKFWDQPNVYFW